MPNITLVEGRLSFEFVDVDFAEQYDGWRHYRNNYNSACGASKAVDFIVSKNQEIWLIEVKDYRRNRRTKPIDLADEVALKVRDTMAGLVSAKFRGADSGEAETSCAALSNRRLRIALHLEQPAKPSRLFPVSVDPANVQLKLRQRLRFADAHPVVCDKRGFPGKLGRVVGI